MKNILMPGNSKMGNQVVCFNLPPVLTCTPTLWCLSGNNGKPACYAMRNRFKFPNVKSETQKRLEFSKTESFVEEMIQAIKKSKKKYFRLHVSGDFYSAVYIRKIMAIAIDCPEVIFRTTTRRRDFSSLLQELNNLPNFIVRESLDTERQIPKMNLPFAALSHLLIVANTDSFHCINDCTKCGHYCWKNRCNVDFDEI